MELTTIQTLAVWALPVLFAVTVHEVAHGYVAYLLGDKTARILGRLTLNPVKHIDIIGTVIVPLVLVITKSNVILGWAKPVPIDPRHLKKPRRDLALIAVAGPSANLIMALIWAAIAKGATLLLAANIPGVLAVYMMGMTGIGINLMLLVLNLLPIPMFDGGHLVTSLLPAKLAWQYERLAPYGILIMLILLLLGVINVVMQPVTEFLYTLIINIYGLSSQLLV